MNRKILLDHYNGITEWVHLDPERPGDLTVEELQDCEPVLEAARRLSEATPGRELRHVAFIPAVIMNRALRERWDPEDFRKWANDPDNKLFRTWPGRL